MKIGFDAKRAYFNRTGLGNYSRVLISNLQELYPENEYYLFSPKRTDLYRLSSDEDHIIEPKIPNPLWRSTGIKRDIRKAGLDLYHGLTNELPFGIHKTTIPSVVTIHDVLFETFPEDYPFPDGQIYRYKTQKAIKEANTIIAISRHTKKELIEKFGAPENKIRVIYQSVDEQFWHSKITPEMMTQVEQELSLPERFLLYVGSVTHRKNIYNLIRAWEQLPDKIPLLIFGGGGKYLDSIRQYLHDHHLEKNIQLRKPVAFHYLPVLYHRAELVIYPSVSEGFGLPVLEALACGAKVVSSQGGSLPEAGGSLAGYVDPLNIESISDGIIRGLNAPYPDRNQLSEHLAKFDRRRITEQIQTLYRDLTGN